MNYNNNDYNLFLLGNILPDINNGFKIKNISKIFDHNYTHYEDDKHYKSFYEIHKKYISNNPLVYGCFVHLYTDYIWNNDFYSKIKLTFLDNISSDEKRMLKQNDFSVCNNKYILNNLELSDFQETVKQANLIERICINEEDLIKVIEFLKHQKTNNKKLMLYTAEELDNLIIKTVDCVLNKL